MFRKLEYEKEIYIHDQLTIHWRPLTIPTNKLVVEGIAFNATQLSAKFQIWCREEFGISDSDSLALWIAGTDSETSYFGYLSNQVESVKLMAQAAAAKITVDGPIDLTNI